MATQEVKYSLTPDRIRKTLEKGDESNQWLEEHVDSGITFLGSYDFGDDVEGAIEKFGDKVVYNYCTQAVGLWLGGRVRDMLESGKSPEEIQEIISSPEFKPGLVTRSKKDPFESYAASVKAKAEKGTLTEEEKEAHRARLEAMLAELQ